MLLDLLQNVAGKTFMYHTYNISTLIVWYNITLYFYFLIIIKIIFIVIFFNSYICKTSDEFMKFI